MYLAPTDTPEHATELAQHLRRTIEAHRNAGIAVDSTDWYRSLMDAATRRMAQIRRIDATGLVDDDTDMLDDAVADWPPRLFEDPHALGWLHEQYAEAARRDSFDAHTQREQKHSSSTITTQLYTPRWIADVLAQGAIAEADAELPEILDPAVGAGQMLLAALAVFARRHPQAPPHRWVEPLWGIDLDERVVDVAQRTIALEIARRTGRRDHRTEQICRRQITVNDSIADTEISTRTVVLTNPPYMGWRSMSEELRQRLDPRFRPYHRDLFSAFIARCHELADESVGILAQQSIWYIRRFEKARRHLLDRGDLTVFLHLGAGAFWNLEGEKASVVAFVQRCTRNNDVAPTRLWDLRDWTDPPTQKTAFENALSSSVDDEADSDCFCRFDVETTRAIPGRPLCHDLPVHLRRLFERLPPLEEYAHVPSQNKTGRNRQYVRQWDEVDPDQLRRVDALGARGDDEGRWVFYSKGGRFAPWWGNWNWVIDWSEEARQFYRNNRTSSLLDRQWWFREGIVYTDFAGRRFNARWMPPGCLFDMTGPAIFPDEKWWPGIDDRQRIGAALAVLNSSPARRMLRALNPTLHFQIRDVRALPIPRISEEEAGEIADDVWQLVAGLRQMHTALEDDPLYGLSGITEDNRRLTVEQLEQLEADIDRRICKAYGVQHNPLEDATVSNHNAL